MLMTTIGTVSATATANFRRSVDECGCVRALLDVVEPPGLGLAVAGGSAVRRGVAHVDDVVARVADRLHEAVEADGRRVEGDRRAARREVDGGRFDAGRFLQRDFDGAGARRAAHPGDGKRHARRRRVRLDSVHGPSGPSYRAPDRCRPPPVSALAIRPVWRDAARAPRPPRVDWRREARAAGQQRRGVGRGATGPSRAPAAARLARRRADPCRLARRNLRPRCLARRCRAFASTEAFQWPADRARAWKTRNWGWARRRTSLTRRDLGATVEH